MSSEYFKQNFFGKDAKVQQAVEKALEEENPAEDTAMDKQVLIRVSESQRAKWQAAAEADGSSVSDWLRQMADNRYREIFECTHPLEYRKSYQWSEFCNKCGARLR